MPARYHLHLVRTGSIAAGKLSLASPIAYTNCELRHPPAAVEGLVALTSSSTARGIKVKLLNADATQAVELDKWYTFTACGVF